MSERHACRLVGQWRTEQRYRPTQSEDEDRLTQSILALASKYGRFGYRRITALLKLAGWQVGKDRVQRIWRREGLKVPARQKPPGRLWLNDGSCIRLRPQHRNHVWSDDFVDVQTHDGRSVQLLVMIDEFTCECLAIRVAGGDPNTEYLSDGITDSLIDSLSQVPNLKVMSRSAVFRYKGKDNDARSAGREMGVRAVLTGRITQRGDTLVVSTELVNVDDNSALWGEQYNRKLSDAFAVQQEIAQQISEKLRLRLNNEQKTLLVKHQTDNPEAYQLYLKGRYYAAQFTAEGLEKAFDFLHQAIAVDPNYALAYDWLAYTYQIQEGVFISPLEVMPKAKEAARKAIDLDETLAAAHVEMATVLFYFDYDWPAAEREFQRALQLNPNYAPAHEFRGWFLSSGSIR